MKFIARQTLLIGLCVFVSSFSSTLFSQSPEAMRSPENQVFQFMNSGVCTEWPDSSTTKSTLYLWIPEKCAAVKGLIIMGTNVPEHMLVGHAALRKVCSENQLAIVWSCPSFLNTRKKTVNGKLLNMALEYGVHNRFLQSMLDSLAIKSGYSEIATAPWLPMGESGHLLMVDALLEFNPQRCIAGIFIKNNHWQPRNRTVPTLTIFGTSQEWGQDKVDMRLRWNNISKEYDRVISDRRNNPNWAFSYVIDGSSGHFDCSEKIVQYMCNYIDAVAKTRLPEKTNQPLKELNLQNGFLADLPIPGHEGKPIVAYQSADTSYKKMAWYPTKQLASEAQKIASINWKSATQMPAFATADGKIAPFNFNGISRVTPSSFNADGISFEVNGVMLKNMPDSFIIAGQPVTSTNNIPVVEWVSGQFIPLGKNRFQIALDRTWPFTANYIGVRQQGNDSIRTIFQPAGLTLKKNEVGQAQTIQFQSIEDVKVGIRSIQLQAKASSGLPVKYFVVAGPAFIKGNELVFTAIPPKSKFPIAVTVAAWQWGNSNEPKFKTAEIVKQQFKIIK